MRWSSGDTDVGKVCEEIVPVPSFQKVERGV